jgi:tetratricopeptide (TPR) repeat protein
LKFWTAHTPVPEPIVFPKTTQNGRFSASSFWIRDPSIFQRDPNLAEAHAQMGRIKRSYDWDWTGADAAYKRGLELEPGNSDVVRGAAVLAFTLGRFDEAIRLGRRAIELDPLRVTTHSNFGLNAYYAGRWDEAEAAFRKALELNPQFPGAHALLGLVYLEQSKLEQALAEMQKEPEPIWRGQRLALANHALGKKKEADAELADCI